MNNFDQNSFFGKPKANFKNDGSSAAVHRTPWSFGLKICLLTTVISMIVLYLFFTLGNDSISSYDKKETIKMILVLGPIFVLGFIAFFSLAEHRTTWSRGLMICLLTTIILILAVNSSNGTNDLKSAFKFSIYSWVVGLIYAVIFLVIFSLLRILKKSWLTIVFSIILAFGLTSLVFFLWAMANYSLGFMM